MLIAFRVTNHKSVRDEAELSFVRSTRMASHTDAGGERAQPPSPVAAIYGANASGKSNILDALDFMAQAVRDSYGRWPTEGPIPITPFALDDAHHEGPSIFEVELLLQDVRHQYGFIVDRERVLEEWLYAYPRRRRQIWFERDAGAKDGFRFGSLLEGPKQKLAALTRPNALFLSVAGRTGHDQLGLLSAWFERALRIARPANEDRRLREAVNKIALSPRFCDWALDVLRYADLGISGVTIEAGRGGLQASLFDDDSELRTWLLASWHASDPLVDDATANTRPSPRRSRNLEPRLRLEHSVDGREPVPMPFESESRGTRALLALAVPALEVLDLGATLLVDELDTSMHPNLVREIVRLFQSPATNPRRAQLVFTSHDTSLLGNLSGEDPLLDRDQVWLTEKDSEGATHLYPLTDFSPRRNENLERGYLQGRYGAVPFFRRDDFETLLAAGE